MSTSTPHAAPTQWISLQEAATRLHISEKTVRRWITTGKITAIRVGPRLIRVDAASLDASAQPINPTAE